METHGQETIFGRTEFPLPGGDRIPVVTYGLLAINLVVWIASSVAGGDSDPRVLLRFGAMFGPLVADGQYWRLLTAMFVHVGIWHSLFNSMALFIFGRPVERFFGHTRFIVIYLLAGLSGSVASFLFNSVAVAAGASGAIFGVLGALIAFFVVQRSVLGDMAQRNIYGLLLLVGINLWFGLAVPGIDNWAHMGGIMAGFLLGLALAPEYRAIRTQFDAPIRVTRDPVQMMPSGVPIGVRDANSLLRRLWVLPVAATILLAGTSLATTRVPDNPHSRIYDARHLIDQGRLDAAVEEIRRALTLDPLEGEAYYLWGRVLAQMGDLQGARTHLGRAVQMSRLTGDQKTRVKARRLLVELGMN